MVNLTCNSVSRDNKSEREFYFYKDDILLRQGDANILQLNQTNTTLTGNYSCLEYSGDTGIEGPKSDPSYFTGKLL